MRSAQDLIKCLIRPTNDKEILWNGRQRSLEKNQRYEGLSTSWKKEKKYRLKDVDDESDRFTIQPHWGLTYIAAWKLSKISNVFGIKDRPFIASAVLETPKAKGTNRASSLKVVKLNAFFALYDSKMSLGQIFATYPASGSCRPVNNVRFRRGMASAYESIGFTGEATWLESGTSIQRSSPGIGRSHHIRLAVSGVSDYERARALQQVLWFEMATIAQSAVIIALRGIDSSCHNSAKRVSPQAR